MLLVVLLGLRLPPGRTGADGITLGAAAVDAYLLQYSLVQYSIDSMLFLEWEYCFGSCSTKARVGRSRYSCSQGAGLAGGDLAQKHNLTLAEASSWCLGNASCAAFTFGSNASCAAEASNSTTTVGTVYFKRGISSNADSSWSFYARTNFTPIFRPSPMYRGCDAPPGSLLPWCNRSATHDKRIASLISELNLTEKIGLLSPTKSLGNPW